MKPQQKRPQSLPRTLASSLESLDLRVTALEQWRADPVDIAEVAAEDVPEDAPVEPQETTPEERGWVRFLRWDDVLE